MGGRCEAVLNKVHINVFVLCYVHKYCTFMKITAGLWFRFREVYYWDSFWTIKGLLLSELYDTTEGMLRNFKVVL
jgi:hypothetical protein